MHKLIIRYNSACIYNYYGAIKNCFMSMGDNKYCHRVTYVDDLLEIERIHGME